MTHMFVGPYPKQDFSGEPTGSKALATGFGLLSVIAAVGALAVHHSIEFGFIPELPAEVDTVATPLLGLISVIALAFAVSEFVGSRKRS